MKIIFICSSLEEGHDGVGDYTRRLAGELISQGNQAAMLSLHDRFIDVVSTGLQQTGNIEIPVMRIPAGLSNKSVLTQAKKRIDDFNPDWLSLQFVPFGFHSKGLPYNLSRQLFFLGGQRKWHVMFHELWVGMAREESKKLLYWGLLQRGIIKSLLLKLRPSAIHTQTHLYQMLLKKLGFNAALLPLFGNIPVVVESDRNKKGISFVVFGLIHDGAPIDKLAAEAAGYAKSNHIDISLTFIGRCGAEQERWAAIWRAHGMELHIMGEQTPAQISVVLLNSTMGISATALAVIEKSGSVAAMRDHGLPVLSVSKPWHPVGVTGIETPPGIIEYQPGNFEACINAKIIAPKGTNVSIVASELKNSLLNLYPANG